MIKVVVDKSDLSRIVKRLESANKRTKDAAQYEITRGAFAIEAGAKRRSPVDTGRLRSSIRTDLGTLRADIGTNVEYAPYIEFGTTRQSAKPFLWPAYEQERKKIIKNLKRLIKV